MTLVLLLAAVGFLALPRVLRRVGRRLAPATWARVSMTALVVGGLTAEVAALLVALPSVLRAAGVPELARACERMLAPLTLGGVWTGWAAAAISFTLPALAAVGGRRAVAVFRDVRAEPSLGVHRRMGRHDVVVLPTAVPFAVSVPGEPGQIMVSEGVVQHLRPEELEAVLHHEAAHLEHRHSDYLVAAAALDHAFAVLPFVRRSTAVLRVALERWADETAVGSDPLRRAALVDALVAVSGLLVSEPDLAAFSSADTVAERVDALRAEPAAGSIVQRAVLAVAAMTLSATVLAATTAWVRDAHLVLVMAGRCAS